MCLFCPFFSCVCVSFLCPLSSIFRCDSVRVYILCYAFAAAATATCRVCCWTVQPVCKIFTFNFQSESMLSLYVYNHSSVHNPQLKLVRCHRASHTAIVSACALHDDHDLIVVYGFFVLGSGRFGP